MFNPRKHTWGFHFSFVGPRIVGKTPIGRVTVEVEAGSEIVLRITDDGRGLPAELGSGLGLRNMASRAEALGGRFDARRGDTGGTVMEWTVPPAGAE